MHTQAEEITQLHAEHARFVRHVVMRYTRDADVVDDLTQQVWLVVCAKLAAFRAQASFKSWLYRVAVTTALQSLRSEKHRKDREQRFAAALPAGFSHDDVRTAGVALLRSLPPRQRRVVLRWSHGYAHEEIGRALRISTGTSKSQLARARRRLHECLAHLRTDTTTSNKFQPDDRTMSTSQSQALTFVLLANTDGLSAPYPLGAGRLDTSPWAPGVSRDVCDRQVAL